MDILSLQKKHVWNKTLTSTSRKQPFLNQNVLNCMSFAIASQLGFFN